MSLCFFRKCNRIKGPSGLISPPYTLTMALSPKSLPSKKDHELFIRPKRRNKTPCTRSRNKSYQQATAGNAGMEDITKAKTTKTTDFITAEAFEKCDQNQKLSTIIASLNKIHNKLDCVNSDLYKEKEGVWPRLEAVEESVELALDADENIRFEMSILKNVVAKQEKQISQLLTKVDELTARQMTDNLTISGLLPLEVETNDDDASEQPIKAKENCRESLKSFLKDYLDLEYAEDEVMDVHRIGGLGKDNNRQMVVRCTPKMKQRVLANANKLAKKSNRNGKPMYINPQVPEAFIAQRKENSKRIRSIKVENSGKPFKLRTKYFVKNKVLHVDGYPVEKPIQPPTIEEILPDEQEQDKMEKVKLWYSDPKQEKGNVFIAIAAKVSSIVEVKRAYRRIRQIYSGATHIAVGYDCNRVRGNQDDREFTAGLCIQEVVEQANVNNKAIFVVRNASSNMLGPQRFQIIADIATDVLAKIK